MKGKVYKARSIQKALAIIKEELGSDAMILSTRRVPKSPRDPYAEEMFEVEAASTKSEPKKNAGYRLEVREDEPVLNYNADSGSRLNYKNKHSENALTDSAVKGRTAISRADSAVKGSAAISRADSAVKGSTAISNSVTDGTIFDELANIKDLISFVGFGSGMASILCNYTESAGIYASLLRAGISEKRAHLILQQATLSMESDQANRTGVIYPLKKYVIRECLNLIHTKELFTLPTHSGMPHVAAFVGPTGVGKTTTIAKLAAELSIKRKKRVGLISIDNYRIGAFEQLKSYAAIMGLLCIAAFTRDDFTRALKKMESMDIVLIDTAGHSHSDNLRMKEVSDVIQADFNISIHLVLSLTTGFLDMREAATAFSKLNPETYVFTKIDETKRCGKIFDQISDLQLPVSILTNGQRVPEDLIIPDTRDLLGIMLGAEQGGENSKDEQCGEKQ